jgi:hypothetical protein
VERMTIVNFLRLLEIICETLCCPYDAITRELVAEVVSVGSFRHSLSSERLV